MKYILLISTLLFITPVFAISGPFPALKKKKSRAHVMRAAEFSALTGVKLTLKEKLVFTIVQKKLHNRVSQKKKLRDPSKTALILAIIGLAIVWIPLLTLPSIPLAIIAISIGSRQKRMDPSDRKARTAVVLGIITLGIVVVYAVAAAYLFSNVQFF